MTLNEVLKTEDLMVDKANVPFDLQVQHFYEVVRRGRNRVVLVSKL